MPSNHLILCHPLLLLPWVFLSSRVLFNELALRIMGSKNLSFNFSISPSNEYSELISFRIDWFDLLTVQVTLKSIDSSISLQVCCCSVAKLCPTLWDPMVCTMPGFAFLHYLSEFAHTRIHWISDAIQPFFILGCPILLSSIFPSISVFSNESALCIRWPKYWSFSISPSNEYSELFSFRIDWFDLLAVQSFLTIQKHHFFGAQFTVYGPTLTSLHDYWNIS